MSPTTEQEHNASLEGFSQRMDERQQWEDHLARRLPTTGGNVSDAMLGIHGNGTFQWDAAPTLEEMDGSLGEDESFD